MLSSHIVSLNRDLLRTHVFLTGIKHESVTSVIVTGKYLLRQHPAGANMTKQ